LAHKTRAPAVEGWFCVEDSDRDGAELTLIGSRCSACGAKFFPPRQGPCPDPACEGAALEDAPLSRTGKVWSYTANHYPPPPPYVAPEPFVPYALAAVELNEENIVVLGQVVPGVGVDDLRVGLPMKLVVGTLNADDEHEYTVWKWQPAVEARTEK